VDVVQSTPVDSSIILVRLENFSISSLETLANSKSRSVIWEIILRDFWCDILRALLTPCLEPAPDCGAQKLITGLFGQMKSSRTRLRASRVAKLT
jgi:hypothetical protein